MKKWFLLVMLLSLPMVAGGLDILNQDEETNNVIDLINPTIIIQTFLDLLDTNSSYGAPGFCPMINAAGNGLEWGNCTSGTGGAGGGGDSDGNASSICGDGEYLDGSGDCRSFNQSSIDIGLTSGFNSTFNATYDSFEDTNASTECGDGEYLDGTFGCLSLNKSIDDRTASTTYFPINITVPAGVHDAGNYTDLWAAKDDRTVNISEASGAAPVLTIIINFTNVTDFNSIIMREKYEGGLGHEIVIGLWDYTTESYEEEYGEITDMNDFAFTNINVLDAADHISGGQVSLRLNHEQNGISSHNFFLDYAVLVDGFSTTVNTEHDALSGRDSKVNHPWAMDTAATRNFSGNVLGDLGVNVTFNWFFGNLNWSWIQNVPNYVIDWGTSLTYLSNFTDDILWTTTFNGTFGNLGSDIGFNSTYNKTYDNIINQQCPTGQVVNGTLVNGTLSCVTDESLWEIEGPGQVGLKDKAQQISMNDELISSVKDPVDDQDAATKKYVDDNDVDGLWEESGGHIQLITDDTIMISPSAGLLIYFRDTGISINSNADGEMTIKADNKIKLDAPNVTTNNLTVNNKICFTADCTIQIYYNGSRLIGVG